MYTIFEGMEPVKTTIPSILMSNTNKNTVHSEYSKYKTEYEKIRWVLFVSFILTFQTGM